MADTTQIPPLPPVKTSSGLASSFGLLQHYRDFRYLWISSSFFFTGAWVQGLMMGWLVYEITASPWLLAVFSGVRLLPMLLGPVGGVLAQRFDRMRLLMVTQVFSVVLTLLLAVLAAADRATFNVLLVTGFLLGIAQWPTQPARTTLVTDIVAKEHISAAMAINHLPMNGTQIIGPLMGGVLVGTLGPAAALIVSALLYGIGIAFMLPIQRVGRRAAIVVASPLRALVGGVRAVLGNRLMFVVLSISASTNFFVWAAYQTFLPVFAKDVLDVGPGGLGFLQTVFGAGTLAAAIGIAALGDFKWKGRLFLWGTAAFGLFYAMFALSSSMLVSSLVLLAAGAASSAFGVMQRTLLLRLAPVEMRDQAIGVLMLAIGVLPLGSVVQGAVADVIGVGPTTFLAGVLLVAHVVAVWLFVPALRRAE